MFIRLDRVPACDRRTDRRNCCRYYSALHCKQCGRAVKSECVVFVNKVQLQSNKVRALIKKGSRVQTSLKCWSKMLFSLYKNYVLHKSHMWPLMLGQFLKCQESHLASIKWINRGAETAAYSSPRLTSWWRGGRRPLPIILISVSAFQASGCGPSGLACPRSRIIRPLPK